MTVGSIIKAVRYCIDEEAVDAASLDGASEYDFANGTHTDQGLMNNIIKNKIPAALRWVCLYAPAEALSASTPTTQQGSGSSETDSYDIINEESNLTASSNILTPETTMIRLIRVKGSQWHRAILGDSALKEDSDEYLQLRDSYGAAATNERPQAAIINTKEKEVEVWPAEGNTFKLTYITANSAEFDEDTTDETTVGVPAALETSFIYYLAYLLLTAYGDGRAKEMFEIATLNLGRSEDKQRQ